MTAVESSITIDVPVATAYEQWSRFEEFPRFMEGVLEVRRLADETHAWKWEIQGHIKESVSEITLRIPTQRIAWRTISGAETSGVAAFEALAQNKTQVRLSLKYDPLGEWDSAEAVEERLRSNLNSFKKLLENGPDGGSRNAS